MSVGSLGCCFAVSGLAVIGFDLIVGLVYCCLMCLDVFAWMFGLLMVFCFDLV